MNNTEFEERFSDLLAMLLKASKMILCLVLILGLLSGLYGVYSAVKEQPYVTQRDVEAAEKNVKIAEYDLAKAQRTLSFRDEVQVPGAGQKVERYERLIQQLQEYMNDSIYYGMNPFHRGAARLCFTVETIPSATDPTEDPIVGIVMAYTKMFPFDSGIMDQVRAIMCTKAPSQYIEELITVSTDESRHIVEICAFNDDLQLAERVVNFLYETMTTQAEENLPQHQVKVLSAFSGYEVDWALNESHTVNEESLINAEKALLEANESYQGLRNGGKEERQAVAAASDALQSAQSVLHSVQTNYTKNRPSLRSIAKRAVKYGVLGGVVGILLGCGYALIKGLFGGIIQNQYEVITRYPFPLIGVLPRTKRVWFDKLICKLERDPVGDRKAVTQATVQSLLARIGERSVCLVSTGSPAVAEKLVAYTENKVKVLGNIINDAEAIRQLASFEGIILVEERGKSRVDSIDAEVQRAKALNTEIIGIILA